MKYLKRLLVVGSASIIAGIVLVFAPLLFNTRPLTNEEVGMLEPIFEESVELEKVRIKIGSPLTFIYPGVTLGNTIAFPKNGYDFEDASSRVLLVHELTHVWQYQNFGLGYIPRSLWETFTQRDTYMVHFTPEKSFLEYDVEEQAEIVAEYYRDGTQEFEGYMEDVRSPQ